MPHPVLYASTTGRLVVLDLPASIAWAQTTEARRLLSVPAVDEPYQTPEPKGQKRVRLLAALSSPERRRRAYIESILRVALEEARRHISGTGWLLTRTCLDHLPDISLTHEDQQQIGTHSRSPCPPLILSSAGNHVDILDLVDQAVVHNPHDVEVCVDTTTHGRFYIPPMSTFINCSIQAGLQSFQEATRTVGPDPGASRGARMSFALILLDPPWSNRSVRNSQSYRSTEDQDSDPFVQVLPLIRQFLSVDGLVAVWITNKARIRTQVLKALNTIGLSLIEEWIWLKITSQGQPISALDGLWRRPYEALLLFAAQPAPDNVQHRILIAAPDIHSRKPSMKVFFDQVLPSGYPALELFARSLTSGWWAWGDEVLKFQHEQYWESSVSP